MKTVKPYKTSVNKKEQIINMFNNIAKNYDTLNRLLSFGIDTWWRKKAIKHLNNPDKILDIATGTADFAITAAKHTNAEIIGIDISKKMLEIGEKKIKKLNLNDRIKLDLADAENLPFDNNHFDAITIGFGVRNFENIEKGLTEIYKTLKEGGVVTILEPSAPVFFPFKQLYNIYFHYLLPIIGGWLSKDKEAYSYLPESVKSFPSRSDFLLKLKNIGFKKQSHIPLSFGIVSLYIAIK